MSRKRVEHFLISARISENNMTREELDFIKEKLKNMPQSELIRNALKIYHKHEEGYFYEELIKKLQNTDKKGEIINNNEENHKKLIQLMEKGFLKKKGDK
jgi:Ca2+-binding EF-hand superfamily protein